MTDFENYLLGKVADYVDDVCLGNIRSACKFFGVGEVTLDGWMEYYTSDGVYGHCPTLFTIGRVLDRLGEHINMNGSDDYLNDNPDSRLTALEKLVLKFLHNFVYEQHYGSIFKASKALNRPYNSVQRWMQYYDSDGLYGTSMYMSIAADVLTKIGVSFEFPEEEQSD